MSKRKTAREVADTLISVGKIISVTNNTLMVNAFGHEFRIDNAYSKTPKITQIVEEVTNEQK